LAAIGVALACGGTQPDDSGDADASNRVDPTKDGGPRDSAPHDARSDVLTEAGRNPVGLGCGFSASMTGGLKGDLMAGGVMRTYTAVVPATYDGNRKLALVIAFHGDNGSGAAFRFQLAYENATKEDAVVLYPDGVGSTQDQTAWDLSNPNSIDMALYDALVTKAFATWCLDSTRIFVVGFSSGGYFANQVACRRSNVRGIGGFESGGPFEVAPNGTFADNGLLICAGKPAAVIVHGDADTDVSYDESVKSYTQWTFTNGCAQSVKPPSPSSCIAVDGCDPPVVWCAPSSIKHEIWSSDPDSSWAVFSKL
jgi:polyhydroxybutyrate depolymerase